MAILRSKSGASYNTKTGKKTTASGVVSYQTPGKEPERKSTGSNSGGGSSQKTLTYAPGSLETMTVQQAKDAGRFDEYNEIVKGFGYGGVSEPAVISSTGARQTIAEDGKTITQAEAGLSPKPKEEKVNEGKTTDDYMAENLRNESETPEEKKLRLARQALEDTYQSIADSYDSLALARENAFNANLQELKSAYNERKEDIIQINKMNVAVVNQAGIRSGQSRYAPMMQGDIVTAEEVAGQNRLKKLDTDYRNTVAAARAALDAGNYELANKKAMLILDLKEKAYNEAVKQAEYAQELNEKTKEKKAQIGLDLAVSGLVSQMNTSDISEMVKSLNESGYEVTADEVKKSYDNLFPTRKNNYAGLGADLEEYYTMKDLGLPLPPEIASLDESKQPFEYIKYKDRITKQNKAVEQIEPLNILDVQRYNELYPDAGVIAGDTKAQANAKIATLNSPEAKLRTLIVGAKDSNNSYETVIKEIENDKTITDKEAAKEIADEVYGVSGETTKVNTQADSRAEFLAKQGSSTGSIIDTLIREGYSKVEATSAANRAKGEDALNSTINQISSFLFK
jgi:hypothetical protein